MRTHRDLVRTPREDHIGGSTQELPEYDPPERCPQPSSIVTAAELDGHFPPADPDVVVRYFWITHPGEVVSAKPPGRNWTPFKTERKGRTVKVHCEYR
jgi:hypothetical protein